MPGPQGSDGMHDWNITGFPTPQLCDPIRRTLVTTEAMDGWCFSRSKWKSPQIQARRRAGAQEHPPGCSGMGGAAHRCGRAGASRPTQARPSTAGPDGAPPPAQGLTASHDISLDKCYVIELNTTIVLPPRNFWELLMNVKRGTYLPQTYIIQEEMVVTEHVSEKEALGSFIYHPCSGKDTYRLRRRATRRRINKRGAKNCNAIRHFENTFVVETLICGVV
ncbi:integral membrane protein 2c-like [Lynx pardinus]|uniref:Integral membrane protein 2 n=1 Tax=Lynx pardinus TaxID=191816 RepID=A0A485NX74_LYNPA|nr:integral membrane protein 2c-like [Lynx pardinus]